MILEQQQICSVMSHLSDSELIHWDIDLAQQK